MRGEGPGDNPVFEEEEGRRWLSRTETLDSRLWDMLETDEVVPGLWRERREEDRPSPIRGENGKKGRDRRREKRRKRNKGWNREGKTNEKEVHHGDGT